MKQTHLSEKASYYLDTFCVKIENRCVGSKGNRQATDFFAECIRSFGLSSVQQEFTCIDWHENDAELKIGNDSFDVHVSPYSLGCDLNAELCHVTTIDELEAVNAAGKILLVSGELASAVRELLRLASEPLTQESSATD